MICSGQMRRPLKPPAIAVVSLLIGGAIVSCSRPSANSGGQDDAKLPAHVLSEWEANVQAKRAATAEPPNVGGVPAANATNPSQVLMEAVQLGDAPRW